MSAYSTNSTQFKDKELLIKALCDMGFNRDEIEVNEKPANLIGYHGDIRKDTAEIIIRRKYVNARLSGGASNDIGFKLQSNGTYGAIISQFDSHYANAAWVGRLTGNYAKHALVGKMATQGFKLANSTSTNNKAKLQFIKA